MQATERCHAHGDSSSWCFANIQERALPNGVEALEANEASDDELEAEHQEAVALMTIVEQRRAGKPQSSADHKAELDKLKQKLAGARCRQLGQWRDDHYCLAKVKRVN